MNDTARAKTDIELSVVVPVYQEEKTVPVFLSRTRPILEQITPAYEIIFALDPGRDRTCEVIEAAIQEDPRIRLLVMTRRWGQPAATMAGIEHCRGRACVVIDVDLQDPPEMIPLLYAKWQEGFDVVSARRRKRDGESWHHLLRARIGYWITSRISEVPIPRDTGDFRLMDRKVAEALAGLKETHGYLRGLVPYVGYKQTVLEFDRDARTTGVSKYGRFLGDMRININALTAFSMFPLQLASILGMALIVVSFVLLLLPLLTKLPGVSGRPWLWYLAGFMCLLNGVTLLCFGIMGEYVGRIYEEVRNRPKYMIAKAINFPSEPIHPRAGSTDAGSARPGTLEA